MVKFSKCEFSETDYLEFRMSVSDDEYDFYFADSYGIGVVGMVKVEGDFSGGFEFKGSTYASIAINAIKETKGVGNEVVTFKHIVLRDDDDDFVICRDITVKAGFSDEEISRAWNYAFNY